MTRVSSHASSWLVLLAVGVLTGSSASAATFARHVGLRDPTTAGWLRKPVKPAKLRALLGSTEGHRRAELRSRHVG